MNREHLIHLNLIEGVGAATINKLIGLSVPLTTITACELTHLVDITCPMAERVVQGLADTSLLEKELILVEKTGSKIITIIDQDYPELLKNIYAPPPVLYYQGSAPEAREMACAIVGSRAANNYGKRILHQLIPPLVEQGWTIVSGGARGVDAYAHYETMQAGGKTMVVLGSGLLKLYPPEHYKLFANIVAKGGTLLSCFPLNVEPKPGNFPARNRIIAGLSKLCVVIQAAAKSGALITAQYALEQGRDVFAVPGPIDDPLSVGCHQLIQQGAGLVQSVADIVKPFEAMSAKPACSNAGERMQETLALNSNGLHVANLPLDQRILRYCAKQPQSLDDLADETGLDPMKLHEPLFQLQLAGKLVQTPAGLYEASVPF